MDPLNQTQQDKALVHRRHASMRMNILLLCPYSHNNVPHEPQRNASMAAVRPSIRMNICVCVYSNSRNDVPRVAQRYGTIAAHTRRRASVLVVFLVFCVHMLSFAD